jgi:hypothetical protein
MKYGENGAMTIVRIEDPQVHNFQHENHKMLGLKKVNLD